MRIYAATLWLAADNGFAPILGVIQRWIVTVEGRNARARERADPSQRALRSATKEEIDAAAPGARQLPSGAYLEIAHLSADDTAAVHSVRYSHRDVAQHGRSWVTEIGLRVQSGAPEIEVSIYLYTDDVSARVSAPVIPTRPTLVRDLLAICNPSPRTPGLRVEELTLARAADFRLRVQDGRRQAPIVVLSAKADGSYPVDASRALDQFAGLADVVRIPTSEDTRKIDAVLGGNLTPYGGAAAIVFPVRQGPYATPVPARRILAEALELGGSDGADGIATLFLAVTERTNLGNARRHISPESVREARSHRLLVRRLRTDSSNDEMRQAMLELEQELELRDKALLAKDREIDQTAAEWYAANDELDDVKSRLHVVHANLEALRSQLSASRDVKGEAREGMVATRAALQRLVAENARPIDCLTLLEYLYGDRVCVLQSALISASESSGFRHGARLWELLDTLAGRYWDALIAGKADDEARKVFPTAKFAAREASLSKEGRRKRTFSYKGQPLVMEPHLKVGNNGGSADTTLRVHFEWVSEDKIIVVGHCGAHIDF